MVSGDEPVFQRIDLIGAEHLARNRERILIKSDRSK